MVINNLHGANVIELTTMDKSGSFLVLFTWHTSAVSHMTGIKIELSDRTLKIPRVQGHPVHVYVVFGRKFCYRREEDYVFYLKTARSYFMVFVKYS